MAMPADARPVLLVRADGYAITEALVPFGAESCTLRDRGEEVQCFRTGRRNLAGLEVFREREAPRYRPEIVWVCRPRTVPTRDGIRRLPGCARVGDRRVPMGGGTKCGRCGAEGTVFDFEAVLEPAEEAVSIEVGEATPEQRQRRELPGVTAAMLPAVIVRGQRRELDPKLEAEILAFWAKEWRIDVARLRYVPDRGGEIWVDGKPEILEMDDP